VGKGVKKNLFFWVFGVRYVRFWLRLFAYINAARRKKEEGRREKGEGY